MGESSGLTSAVAANMKRLRNERKLSQAQVAHYVGIDQSMVSKMESGERAIPLATMEKLCDLFFCSLQELTLTERRPHAQLAFRSNTLQPDDLNALAEIGRIVRNLETLTALEEACDDR